MAPIRRRALLATLALVALVAACGGGSESKPPVDPSVTLDVSAYFPAGTVVHDAYSDVTATVSAAGTVTVTPAPEGVALLEAQGAAATPFTWKNATTYFVVTDRFANGEPANDGSYGRHKDGGDEVGTWHGGDWKGLTGKLDYIASLGVTALWITPIVEQVHGWVGGGSGGFKHHGYHGYYALDFTRLDQNLGTLAELQELVTQAHLRGIRVLADVVINHPGYATGDDLVTYLPEVFKDGTGDAFKAWSPSGGQTWLNWNDFVNYGSVKWPNWWGVNWIRAGLGGGYQAGGGTDETLSLNSLPDFKTEATATVAGLPPFLAPVGTVPGYTTPKADTGVTEIVDGTVRDYLVKWHTDWLRQVGFDGFRCDTAKNVEKASWKALKDAATVALADWKAAHPGDKLDDAPFWMTGEVFGHGVSKDDYYTAGGFDSLINFSFQKLVESQLTNFPTIVDGATDLNASYKGYSDRLAGDPSFDILSFVSNHDTELMFAKFGNDAAKQRDAGTMLLLVPGGAQVFYGDESGRTAGPSGGDPNQPTRSDMNWTTTNAALVAHWSKLGTFRKRHAAIGAGVHARLTSPDGTYAFARTLDEGGVQDEVVVVIARPR
jgi:alpha-amylase